MAENGGLSSREYGGHPSSLSRELQVPNGIYAPMNPVESPCSRSMKHLVFVEPCSSKLCDGDGSVLSSGNFGDQQIGGGALVAHIPTKAPVPLIRPPRRS